jgi:membrane protease YdiL (CAAX protease family)
MRAIFREILAPFTREFTGRNRWIHLAFVAIAALFLCYIYLGKDGFMKGDGYGITARLSGQKSVTERQNELAGLKREAAKALPSENMQARMTRIEAQLVEDGKDAPSRARAEHYLRYVLWFLSTFVILFVIPVLFISLHPRLRLRDYGVGLGDWRFSVKIFGILASVMLLAVLAIKIFKIQGFMQYYPMFAVKRISGAQPDFLFWFIIVELCFFLYFIGWEFFFRGLLVFPLSRRIGSLAALVGLVPFAIMHAGKPVVEAFGSIIAAWFLGILVLRARSFWVCPVLHFAIAFVMDLMAALSRNLF